MVWKWSAIMFDPLPLIRIKVCKLPWTSKEFRPVAAKDIHFLLNILITLVFCPKFQILVSVAKSYVKLYRSLLPRCRLNMTKNKHWKLCRIRKLLTKSPLQQLQKKDLDSSKFPFYALVNNFVSQWHGRQIFLHRSKKNLQKKSRHWIFRKYFRTQNLTDF